MKIYKIYNKKSILKILLFITTLFILLTFSKQNFNSVKKSTELFINNIFPSLFPFFLFSELILNSNIIELLVQYFGNIISKIFKIDKNATSAIIIGFFCGYPMGAKVVSELYEKHKISYIEAKRLLMFVNNCNPIFIISTIGISIFNNNTIGYILLFSHFISSIIMGILSKKVIPKKIYNNITKKNASIIENNYTIKKSISFFQTIKTAILNSFLTLINIFGFIIIFNLIFDILSTLLNNLGLNYNIICFISGIFEVTRGCISFASSCPYIVLKICTIS